MVQVIPRKILKAPYSSKVDIVLHMQGYGINTIIKFGNWQPVKFQLVSRFWNEMIFFIVSLN